MKISPVPQSRHRSRFGWTLYSFFALGIWLSGTLLAGEGPIPVPPASQKQRNTPLIREEDEGVPDIEDEGRNIGETEHPEGRSRFRRFDLYVEAYTRYKDEEFKEEEDERHESGMITTASTKLTASLLDREKSSLDADFRFRRNFDSRPDSSDWSDFDLTLSYRGRKNWLQTTFFSTPDKLAFFRGDEAVFKDVSGVEFSYRRRLTRRLSLGGRYELSREIFSGAKERDATRHDGRIHLKYRFHSLLYPGIGLDLDSKRAASENFERKEIAPVLLLSSHLKDRAIMSMTWRYRFRNYTTPDDSQSNFEREDLGPALFFVGYLRLKGQIWLRLAGSLEKFDSTKQGRHRDFNKREIAAGLRYYFP